MGKGPSALQLMLGKLDIPMQKKVELKPPHTIYSNNSVWIKHLNVRLKTTELSEESIGQNL